MLCATWARADRLEDVHAESLRGRKRIMWTLIGGGLASTAAGVGFTIPDGNDQAWRVGGALTLSFGVINGVIGTLGLLGTLREERGPTPDARKLLRDTAKEQMAFGVNLGLDVGYLLAAGAAILASQLGVDNGERWLAGGVAAGVQALFLIGVDSAGVVHAGRVHARLSGMLDLPR
jgi:hypothetical protein